VFVQVRIALQPKLENIFQKFSISVIPSILHMPLNNTMASTIYSRIELSKDFVYPY